MENQPPLIIYEVMRSRQRILEEGATYRTLKMAGIRSTEQTRADVQ